MDAFRRRIFEGPKQECALASVAAVFAAGDKARPLSTADVDRAARAAEVEFSAPEIAAVVRDLHSSSAPSTPHANLMTTATAGYKTGPTMGDGTYPRPLSTVTARSRFDETAVNHLTGLHGQQQQRQENRDAETDLHQLSKRQPPEHPRGGTVGNFLMRLRGPITEAKRRVIDRAWTRATDAAAGPKADLHLVLSHYDAERAPRVARGDRSIDEELVAVRAALTFSSSTSAASPTSSAAVVSYGDFYDFHLSLAGLGLTDDKMFIGVVERLWRLDQPDRRLAPTNGDLLQSKVPPLFKSSTYWGHDTDNHDVEPDADIDYRRGTEPQHKINPFPAAKAGVAPAHLHGAYAAPTLPAHKARTLRDGMETLGNTYAFTGQPSTHGVVKTDPKSRGFLNTDRSNAAYGAGELDAGPRDAFDDGRAKEDAIANRRRDLQLAPLETADPALWTTTHNREHPNWGKVINRGNPAILTSDATKAAQGAGAPLGLRPAYAREMGDDELKRLERELKDHNRSYRKGAPTFDWRTTQREHFAPIDFPGAMDANDRFNPQPQAHATLLVARAMATQSGDASAESAVLAASHGAEKRIGSLPTEYTDHMVDHKGNAEYDGTYHHYGVFNLIQGKQQIRVPWHKPNETLPGVALNSNSIAPLQFTATTSLYHDRKPM